MNETSVKIAALINPWIAACKQSSEKKLPELKYCCIIHGCVNFRMRGDVFCAVLLYSVNIV